MTVSRNVKQETMQALQESSSQSEAARKLGISQPALYYRLKHDPDLMEIAVRKGFVRGKDPESPVVREAKRILGVAPTPGENRENPAPTQGEDREKAAETTDQDPVFTFKGELVLLGETFQADVRVERR